MSTAAFSQGARTGAGFRDGEAALGRLPLTGLKRLSALLTAGVILLGILRELFVAAYGTGTALRELRPIALDMEQCLAAWYSSALMLVASMLLYLAGASARGGRAGWYGLAAIFLLMSVDETISGHEILVEPMRGLVDAGGVFHFAWVIPGLVFVACAGLLFIPFLLALPRRTAAGFVLAGALFVGGALGMEMVGGLLVTTEGFTARYMAAAILEESLEMIGLTVFLFTLADHLLAGRRELLID